ncbi:hypothetical protein AURDEDRAFT_174531 [Auricularia subglabra TFB-10046 SS5]|uniref:Uncharacterized protein n=1 Tax=Auricularia subglabra (strain TFB-10046 / SS5) TaxID=717982 RepID=J0WUG3_AURST|nr:hypothetical protein AURDEDRAFT_174531 [Auricularia subglabra TFB-10046 SS5]
MACTDAQELLGSRLGIAVDHDTILTPALKMASAPGSWARMVSNDVPEQSREQCYERTSLHCAARPFAVAVIDGDHMREQGRAGALARLRDGTRCCCNSLASASLRHPRLLNWRLSIHAIPTALETGACDAAIPSSLRTSASPAASTISVYNPLPTRQVWRLSYATRVSHLHSTLPPIPLPAACHIAGTLVLRLDRRLTHASGGPTARLGGGSEVCLRAGELPFSYK